MSARSKPSVLFWIITLIFLLWNLIGVAFFFTEMFASDMIVAQMSPDELTVYENRPAWYMGNYGMAVFGALIACIALLFKHRSALWFALVSLIALLISTTYNFTIGAWDVVSTADKAVFLMVPFFGLLLVLFTFYSKKKGWIN